MARRPCKWCRSERFVVRRRGTRLGLSRRRSRVRVPSLPLSKVPAFRQVVLSHRTRPMSSWPNPVAQTSCAKYLQRGTFYVDLVCGRTKQTGSRTSGPAAPLRVSRPVLASTFLRRWLRREDGAKLAAVGDPVEPPRMARVGRRRRFQSIRDGIGTRSASQSSRSNSRGSLARRARSGRGRPSRIQHQQRRRS